MGYIYVHNSEDDYLVNALGQRIIIGETGGGHGRAVFSSKAMETEFDSAAITATMTGKATVIIFSVIGADA